GHGRGSAGAANKKPGDRAQERSDGHLATSLARGQRVSQKEGCRTSELLGLPPSGETTTRDKTGVYHADERMSNGGSNRLRGRSGAPLDHSQRGVLYHAVLRLSSGFRNHT